MSDPTDTTHFGYQTVTAAEKNQRVQGVFDSVARRYDRMNDLMSLGLHRLWKRFAVELCRLRPGQRVLDLAGGTGDLAEGIFRATCGDGQVVLADRNAAMLSAGHNRRLDGGWVDPFDYVQADAEQLPFPSGSFDAVIIGFGLRNVTHPQVALGEMQRVLKAGGRGVVLEFSHPYLSPLKSLYDAYSFAVLPTLGRLVANDGNSYRYLAESIRRHPDQGQLLALMGQAGFEGCECFNLHGGIVAIHRGYRL
ncbi:MAG: class I SAM-dependent methyltransferase [Candidatus Competibacterales bacterium]